MDCHVTIQKTIIFSQVSANEEILWHERVWQYPLMDISKWWIYGFKFPKKFVEISCRDLTRCQSQSSKDLITNPSVSFSFAFARLNALQAAVRHSHNSMWLKVPSFELRIVKTDSSTVVKSGTLHQQSLERPNQKMDISCPQFSFETDTRPNKCWSNLWTCNKEAGLPRHIVVHTIHREVIIHAVFCGCHFVIRDKIFDHLFQKNDTN